ncbi:hypothetical protein D3C75_1225540 [compost metagenome]
MQSLPLAYREFTNSNEPIRSSFAGCSLYTGATRLNKSTNIVNGLEDNEVFKSYNGCSNS